MYGLGRHLAPLATAASLLAPQARGDVVGSYVGLGSEQVLASGYKGKAIDGVCAGAEFRKSLATHLSIGALVEGLLSGERFAAGLGGTYEWLPPKKTNAVFEDGVRIQTLPLWSARGGAHLLYSQINTILEEKSGEVGARPRLTPIQVNTFGTGLVASLSRHFSTNLAATARISAHVSLAQGLTDAGFGLQLGMEWWHD